MNAAHIPMCRRRLAAGLAGLVVLMGSVAPQQAFAQGTNNYDTDNDNLIEVRTLEQLNAIRYDLDGDGVANTTTPSYTAVFQDPLSSSCLGDGTCDGYELMADLDFDTSGDDQITEADNPLSWGAGADAGSGWQPIGTSANPFAAEFHGNGNTISHLFIHSTGTDFVGLFRTVDDRAVIRSVGLVGVNVTGNNFVGSLAGLSGGPIRASYATGEVNGNNQVGGLVGRANGESIHASYATGEVNGNTRVGGLVGQNFNTDIRASYATGEVNGNNQVGGLVGRNSVSILANYATGKVIGNANTGGLVGAESGGSIRDSYFDTDTSGLMGARGTSTVVLRSPTDYTGIYANWNVDLDSMPGGDDPWDFGTNEQYPVLQVDFNGDGRKSWQEFGPQQFRPGVLVSPVELSLTEGTTGSYTVVLLSTPTASVTVRPMSNNTTAVSVSVNSDELTFTNMNWSMPQTVTVSAEEDDNVVGERVSLMHTVVSIGNYASVTASNVTVNVTDNDSPVAVSTGTLSLMEGTTGSYTVVLLGMPTTSPVTVTPVVMSVSGNTTAVRVSGALTFTDMNWNTAQTVMVGAVDDDNAINEEARLTHTISEVPNYAPEFPPVVVTVNVTDDDGGIRVRVRVFLEGPLR